MDDDALEEISDLEMIADVPFPRGLSVRKLVVTGTPGSGKSTLIQKLKGWPEEGYLDLSAPGWWKSQVFHYRPRELHFGLPFFGHEEAFAVYDTEKTDPLSRLELDVFRIPLPAKGMGLMRFLSDDWRAKYVFEFQILPAEKVYAYRKERAKKGSHHVDRNLTLERVREEVEVYRDLALFFHRTGWNVHVRDDYNGVPKRFTEAVSEEIDMDVLYQEQARKRDLYKQFDRLKLRQSILTHAWSHHANRELLDLFVEILPKVFDAERCSIFIRDSKADTVWLESGTGVQERQIEVPTDGSLVGQVISSGKPLVENDMDARDGAHHWVDRETGFTSRNMVCVPVQSLGKSGTGGAIQVLNKKGGALFTEADRELLERFAHHLQVAIENVYLSQDMIDFSALLSQQVERSDWMTTWWGIGLWFVAAAAMGTSFALWLITAF